MDDDPAKIASAAPGAARSPTAAPEREAETPPQHRPKPSLLAWIKGLGRTRSGEDSVRATLDELIEEREEAAEPLDDDERRLLTNILELRTRTVYDLMVPRADIVAAEASAPLSAVIETMTKGGHSRLPVYRETLDDVIGMVHIKDVVAWRGRDEEFSLANIMRKVLFVSPSMRVLEMLLEMRVKRIHMALVVDEFGGVDGLLTIEDLVEEIVGEIEDEHDRSADASLVRHDDGTYDVDARFRLEDFEEAVGPVFAEDEKEEIDTLGGLVVSLAGHVPIRGELVRHPAGLEFEVLDADPRRVKRLRLRMPAPPMPE